MHLSPVTCLRGKTAIGTGDYILAADEPRKTDQAFGDPFWMLHDIAGMRNNAGYQDYAFW